MACLGTSVRLCFAIKRVKRLGSIGQCFSISLACVGSWVPTLAPWKEGKKTGEKKRQGKAKEKMGLRQLHFTQEHVSFWSEKYFSPTPPNQIDYVLLLLL